MEVINLWDNVPGFEEGHHYPTLEYYAANNKRGKGTVIICPGGGYVGRASHEGKGYAEFLNKIGLDAFVLEYRVAPSRFPYPLLDARRAVRYVRYNAEKFGIDTCKIAVMGSSAGGHLAALLSTYNGHIDGEGVDNIDEVDYRPNAQILCYPVTDSESHEGSYRNLLGEDCSNEKKRNSVNPIEISTSDTPPAFIWHTETDPGVKVTSTYKYAMSLRKNNVRVEMHIYPDGGHGLGLAENNSCVRRWSKDLEFWLEFNEYIKK